MDIKQGQVLYAVDINPNDSEQREEKTNIVIGEVYLFVKSGNRVKVLEQTKECLWRVERVETGKRMIVKESALVPAED